MTKIDEIYQDSENPVIHNGPKSTKIAPVSQKLTKSDSKFTKIDKVDQDSENPVNLNGPKSTEIVPVSQNEPKVSQDLPKLMELTNIVRT